MNVELTTGERRGISSLPYAWAPEDTANWGVRSRIAWAIDKRSSDSPISVLEACVHPTPLHDEHVALGAKIVDFNGWALPVQFDGIVREHSHTRSQTSIFDCSHMGEFHIQGKDALSKFDN